MDTDEVQYYDHYEKTLKHTQKYKARQFIKNDCIKYIGNNTFICEPIQGYNTRTYTLLKENGRWTCNCQFFVRMSQKGEDLICSHLRALFIHFKNGKFGDGLEEN